MLDHVEDPYAFRPYNIAATYNATVLKWLNLTILESVLHDTHPEMNTGINVDLQ